MHKPVAETPVLSALRCQPHANLHSNITRHIQMKMRMRLSWFALDLSFAVNRTLDPQIEELNTLDSQPHMNSIRTCLGTRRHQANTPVMVTVTPRLQAEKFQDLKKDLPHLLASVHSLKVAKATLHPVPFWAVWEHSSISTAAQTLRLKLRRCNKKSRD